MIVSMYQIASLNPDDFQVLIASFEEEIANTFYETLTKLASLEQLLVDAGIENKESFDHIDDIAKTTTIEVSDEFRKLFE